MEFNFTNSSYRRTSFIPEHFWEALHIQHISNCNQLSVLSNLMVSWLSPWKAGSLSHSSPYTPRGIAPYHGDHSNPLPTSTRSWSTTSESSHNQKSTTALGFILTSNRQNEKTVSSKVLSEYYFQVILKVICLLVIQSNSLSFSYLSLRSSLIFFSFFLPHCNINKP